MTKSPSEAAASAVASLRAQPWGLAVAAIADGETAFVVDPGADNLDEDSQFQIGSVTKTVTGLLLADCIGRGEASLDTTVGTVLGADAGNCAELTLGQIGSQQSGLPRLPPNLSPDKVDRSDPYAAYLEADLLEALTLVPRPEPGGHSYSNFGFMLLGCSWRGSRVAAMPTLRRNGSSIRLGCHARSVACRLQMNGYPGTLAQHRLRGGPIHCLVQEG